MARRWSDRHLSGDNETNRAARDSKLLQTASRQRRLIRADQRAALGFSRNGISRRLATGRLFRVHRGVHALHPPPYDGHQRYLAAVFAGGPGALLSNWPAAAPFGLLEAWPAVPHITNLSGRGRGLAGIVVHRSPVDPADATSRHGIPCTSVARTVIDVAPTARARALEDLILASDSFGLLNRRRLSELLTERAGRPGTRKVLELITDDPIEARSANERRMFSICREFGVPPPLVNYRIEAGGRTFYADFCWPELRLIIEADSWRWHGGRLAGENDADRDQILAIAGWRIIHFTRDQIKHERSRTGRRLLALTGGSLASGGSFPIDLARRR